MRYFHDWRLKSNSSASKILRKFKVKSLGFNFNYKLLLFVDKLRTSQTFSLNKNLSQKYLFGLV